MLHVDEKSFHNVCGCDGRSARRLRRRLGGRRRWNGWIAPPGATNAPVTVQADDYFTFIPGVSGPSVFHVFGRAPDFPGAVAPYFSWMGVDPAGAFAELGIAPGGLPVDILSLSSSEGLRSSGWSHLGRLAGHRRRRAARRP